MVQVTGPWDKNLIPLSRTSWLSDVRGLTEPLFLYASRGTDVQSAYLLHTYSLWLLRIKSDICGYPFVDAQPYLNGSVIITPPLIVHLADSS